MIVLLISLCRIRHLLKHLYVGLHRRKRGCLPLNLTLDFDQADLNVLSLLLLLIEFVNSLVAAFEGRQEWLIITTIVSNNC